MSINLHSMYDINVAAIKYILEKIHESSLHNISHFSGFTLLIAICMSFLQVIGDKSAAKASEILRQREGRDSLRKLEDKLGVQLKFIHVIRNPFDNIATMALRIANLKKNKRQDDLKVGSYT